MPGALNVQPRRASTRAGQNLVLTIDQTIQYIAEKELAQGMEDTKAIAGTVVVENPRTGEILALANWPTFNPNVFNHVSHRRSEEPCRQRHL